jgi:hypothetical protein
MLSWGSGQKIPVAPIALLCAAAVLLALIVSPPQPDNLVVLAELHRKQERLAQCSSPKVILIGGSNLAFGVDSGLLQKALHRPVVNMGIHAGLGLRYMLAQCKPFIQEGDFIIVSPEYEHFYGQFQGSMTLAELLVSYPNALKYFSPLQIALLPGFAAELLRVKQWCYFREGRNLVRRYVKHTNDLIWDGKIHDPEFNSLGDEISHLSKPPRKFEQAIFLRAPAFDESALAELQSFNTMVKAKGARLVVSLPYLWRDVYMANRKRADMSYVALKRIQLVVPRSPSNSVFPACAFYDAPYHLTGEYRQIRTRQMLSDIKQVSPDIVDDRIASVNQ